MRIKTLTLCLLLLFTGLAHAGSGNNYQAPKAQTAPVINGSGSDACWTAATWYTIDQLWLGVQPSAADFTGRFKVSWDEGKVYLLAEITDDVLSDKYADPLSNYWEDDAWEIFFDEDHSGGMHENNYNAWAYHISTLYDIVDSDLGTPRLFNSHATVQRTKSGNVYTWEAAFIIYTDAYVYANGSSNPRATLTAGKVMGFGMAYCDNDGAATRDSFIGSEVIAGTNKNVAYQNAGVFGNLTLMDCPGGCISTAIQESRTASGVKVAPQPFEDDTHISLEDGSFIQSYSLRNAGGQEIGQASGLHAAEVTVGQTLSPGVYTLTVTGSNGRVYMLKLVKQ